MEGRLNLGFEELRIFVAGGKVISLVGLQRRPDRFRGNLTEVLRLCRYGDGLAAEMKLADGTKVQNQAKTMEELFFGKGGFYATAYQKLFDLTGLELYDEYKEALTVARVYNEALFVFT